MIETANVCQRLFLWKIWHDKAWYWHDKAWQGMVLAWQGMTRHGINPSLPSPNCRRFWSIAWNENTNTFKEIAFEIQWPIVSTTIFIDLVIITMTSWWARWPLKSPASRLFTNRLFGRRSEKTLKLRVTGLCAGNSPVTGEFPAQRASNVEIVSIWWRHHDERDPNMQQVIIQTSAAPRLSDAFPVHVQYVTVYVH